MTWIESFPFSDAATTPKGDPAYLFFVDIEGHSSDDTVQRTIEAARKRCERLEILGSYPRGGCIES